MKPGIKAPKSVGGSPRFLGGSLKAEGLGDGWTLAVNGPLFAGQAIPKLRLRLPPNTPVPVKWDCRMG